MLQKNSMNQSNKIAIEFQTVSKAFKGADNPAVNDVSFSVREGEFITILGSSGCGKTTLLKMTNRLYEPDKGNILLFGQNIADVDPVKLRRKIGYVIQQVGLFPHMTIEENIAVVPKLMQWEKGRTNARVDELLQMVGLEPGKYRKRYPSQLSGGQQQRVGLARALAGDPQLMLLDEPFGALDAITRTGLQNELQNLHQKMGKTFLFVTHDINEALKLGNRVIIMSEGCIRQYGTPEEIVRHPADPFVETLISSARSQEKLWDNLLGEE
ncbi:ABC transporter ATP-binding protein [Roseburia hominis]